ncbi:DNA-binding protein HU-1 (plasmid) [Euzebya pacifica]|uniref:DNA-binding protein HU-1 n=1 Tax=Euzebya pacifica TaxID=1608957 RepID=A0A346Y6U1_9ACTN|nr:DNA-binding protein HU-1 [Euzebya pacifica]
MNKAELVADLVDRLGADNPDLDLTHHAVDALVTAFTASIVEAAAAGDRVVVAGLGTFELTRRNARTGRNPHTGEAVPIPARMAPKFTPAAAFKRAADRVPVADDVVAQRAAA